MIINISCYILEILQIFSLISENIQKILEFLTLTTYMPINKELTVVSSDS